MSNSGPPSTALLTSVNGVPWRNFSMSTVAHAKMGHVSPTTPLLGMTYHPFGIGVNFYKAARLEPPPHFLKSKVFQLSSPHILWDANFAVHIIKLSYTVCGVLVCNRPICLSVRMHMSEIIRPGFAKFTCYLWLDGIAVRYVGLRQGVNGSCHVRSCSTPCPGRGDARRA